MASISKMILRFCGMLYVGATLAGASSPASSSCNPAEGACAADASHVVAQEDLETAALRMDLMQRQLKHTQKISTVKAEDSETSTNSGTQSKAASPTSDLHEEKDASQAELVSKDQNGHLCMLCNKPLPERSNKQYTEFRTDCGKMSSAGGPNASILSMPAVKLTEAHEDGTERNGFCQLNFAKSCVDAVANKDYLYWAKSLDLKSPATRANSKWDGRYCRLNGFLEPSLVALQHDFEGTRAKSRDLCKTKYAKYNIDNITFIDMMSAARYEDESAPTLDEAELLAAWNCAMGDLGCDISLCAYSFCATESGTGLYDECKGWHPVDGMPIP